MPWAIVDKLPLLKDALADRMMVYADISFILITALGFEHYLQVRKSSSRRTISAVLLIAVIASWFPTYHFWRQEVHSSAHLFQQGQISQVIAGKPVFVLVDNYWDFGYVMQAVADGGYRFPVTNVYGFPYTSFVISSGDEADPSQILFEDAFYGISATQAKVLLVRYLQTRHPAYVLWLKDYGSPIPKSLQAALQQLCGQPLDVDGSLLWKVSSSLPQIIRK